MNRLVSALLSLTLLIVSKLILELNQLLLNLPSRNQSTLNPQHVTKADVINQIADKTGIDKADVSASVEAFFNIVKSNMAAGQNIYVRGFGSFINKKRKKKIARNISRNTAIVIDEHYIPSFKPAKIFVNKIKNSDKVKQMAEK
jgi:DNA-binding protein HU-beta